MFLNLLPFFNFFSFCLTSFFSVVLVCRCFSGRGNVFNSVFFQFVFMILILLPLFLFFSLFFSLFEELGFFSVVLVRRGAGGEAMTEGIRGGHCPQSPASFAQVAESVCFVSVSVFFFSCF